MKKVVLKKVDLVKFNNFIDTLIPLDEASTIYFKIDKHGIKSDAHNSSGTLIKSLRADIRCYVSLSVRGRFHKALSTNFSTWNTDFVAANAKIDVSNTTIQFSIS